MQHIFIVGSKGIPSAYGGYETFVDKLTEYHKDNKELKYHVACKSTEYGEYEYHNARCFKIAVPDIGAAQAIYYDVAALKSICAYIKQNNITNPIVYILACRIGPYARYYRKKIHKLGGRMFVNPDGHEWMRAKWSLPVRRYWKISERMMVKNADLLVCDSKNIESYIRKTYLKYNPDTVYIAYGAETRQSTVSDNDERLISWYEQKGLRPGDYYLVVGRFVPENNYEIMIREFMKSNSRKDFVLITNVSEKFLEVLKTKTGFDKDVRIKFVGTIYEPELLMKIRENAYAYLHGHEVGGTNPSLLEALGSTGLNLLLDVGFNREVAEDGAVYWVKTPGCLAGMIEKAEQLTEAERAALSKKAKRKIMTDYSWNFIADKYKALFLAAK
ncbi:beta 1-4 rhamnosyltransferase Cps2T [uncultured Clostridium sp.]|uniref:beta 1-4 rhamnosyltransferase Cps2T n=1 Tax=uncultured Clostridium sp. TaxID=59620 RepID=UPI0025EE1C0D|nr:DUF1972 domain-containing protein [uncultured Clostridium sp.]